MSAVSFIKKINNKKVLLGAITIFIFPFVLFCFWNFPSADDYMILNKKSQFSFWQLQNDVYHNWTGRYFATLLSCTFSYWGFLYSHYYLHTLLLLSFTVFSWLFCLTQVNKYLLNNVLARSSLFIISLLLLILQVNVIPEAVTAFYWFSSAVTYQVPLIIIIFLTGIIVKSFFVATRKMLFLIIACFLVIMLNGCNEIITLFVLINSSFVYGYFFISNKKIPFFITCLFIINIVSACFLLFSPGILNRGAKFGNSTLPGSAIIAFAKWIVINWYFLKEPLWWLFVFFATIFLSVNKNLFRQIPKKKMSLPVLLAFYVISGVLVYLPVLYVTNGSLPARAENTICFLYSLILIIIISAFLSRSMDVNTGGFSIIYKYRYLLCSIIIFSTGNMKKITDSLLSGYFYNLIMKERLNMFVTAKQQNIHELTFDDYATAVDKKIKEHPAADRQMLREIMEKPPTIICFENDLYDVNFIKEYYRIKQLNIRKK